MTPHITYETAKRLKEFLGESAPDPMEKAWWIIYYGKPEIFYGDYGVHHDQLPAYRLEDLLSKPFCETMVNKGADWREYDGEARVAFNLSAHLAVKYFQDGLPAVEKALCEMMEGK